MFKMNTAFPALSGLLMILLASQIISSDCSEGCLRCEVNQDGLGSCSTCDIFTGFIMSPDGDCIKHEDPNCLVFAFNENDSICSQCMKGYIIDEETKNCVEVPSEKKIMNCHSYTLIGRCSLCARDTYMNENECLTVKIKRSNCFKYFDDSLCSVCDEGFKLDLDSGNCVSSNSENADCLLEASSECTKCDYGYISTLNPMNFVTDKQSYVQKTIHELFWGQKHSQYPVSSCVKSPDMNCLEFEATLGENSLVPVCKTCKKNFFLNSVTSQCDKYPMQGILNCSKYADFLTCSECSAEFYLECNECKSRSVYSNCSIPDTRKDRCHTCSPGYFLNESFTCQQRSVEVIENCLEYNRLEDMCETCESGYLLTNTSNMCFKEIFRCITYKLPSVNSDTKRICESCSTGYYLDEQTGKCNFQFISNCLVYFDNHNLCKNCRSGYTLVNNECVDSSITLPDGCQSATFGTTQCTACKNLYYLTDSSECLPIDDVDCLQNTFNMNSCQICKANRYLQTLPGTTNERCNISDTAMPVSNCLNSSSNDPDQICSECEADYHLIDDLYYSQKNPEGCLSDGLSDRRYCNYLDVDFEYGSITQLDDEIPAPIATPTPNSVCSQLFQRSGTPLNEAYGTCIKCRDPKTHFLNNMTCFKRSKMYTDQCEEYNEDKDECKTCKAGSYAVPRDIEQEIKCLPNPDGFVALSNCLVHDASDSTLCVVCDSGYYLSTDRVCVQVESGKRNLDVKLNVYFTSDKFTPMVSYKPVKPTKSFGVRYCQEFVKYDLSDDESLCMKCLPDTYQVKMESPINYNENGNFGYFSRDSYYCYDQTNFTPYSKMENNQKVPYVSADECLDATVDEKYIISCQNCKNGLIPTFIKIDYGDDATMQNTHNYTVESCVPTDNSKFVEKKYSGLGFKEGFTSGTLGHVKAGLQSVSFDSCKNENENLIYLFVLESNPDKFDKIHWTSMQETVKLYDCLVIDDSDVVEGCQIYNNIPSKWNEMLDGVMCMSCKPGYSASNSHASYPFHDLTCSLIDNCDFSDPSKNTMMNGCNNCLPGFTNPMKQNDLNQMYIDYTECSAVTIENCLHEFTDETACVVCKQGYVVSDDKQSCVLAPLPDNCDSIGILAGSVYFDKIENNLDEYQSENLISFVSRYMNEYKTGSCKTCSAGHSHFVDINSLMGLDDPTFKCVSHEGADDTIPNCELYSGAAEKTCAKCTEDYIVTKEGQCVANSDNIFKDCEQIEMSASLNEYVCSKCKIGYAPEERDQKRCFETVHFCKEFMPGSSTPICILCQEGYFAVSGDNSPGSYCVKNSDINPYLNPFLTVIKETGGTLSTEISILVEGYNDILPPQKKTQRQTCFPNKLMPFCADPDFNSGGCNICEDGYYKRGPMNQCFPNSIEGCDVQSNLYECATCNEEYVKTDLNQCNKRFALYCNDTSPDADQCTTCHNDYYLTDNKCFPITVEHCQQHMGIEDKCVVCKDGFYVENSKCYPHTVVGCKTFSPSANECLTCFDQHYISSGICYKHTVKYCDSYNASADRCDSCLRKGSATTNKGVYNYLSEDGTCHQSQEIMNCQKYFVSGANIGKCEECQEGYMNINYVSCDKKPSGISDCQEYSAENVCSMCDPSYYLDITNNKCLPVFRPIENCWNHQSLTECDKCVDGFIPSTDKTSCLAIVETSCKSWAGPSICSECPPNKLLFNSVSGGETVEIKTECKEYIPNCQIIVQGAYELSEEELSQLEQTEEDEDEPEVAYHCQKCDPGYFTTGKRTTCSKSETPILNCIDYSKEDECQTCEKDYVLSVNKKECFRENNRVGANCRSGMLIEESVCRVCMPGKVLNEEGSCVDCGGNGCLQCDPKDTTKCLMCHGGYHMTVDLVCEANTDNKLNLQREELMDAEQTDNDQTNVTVDLN